MEEPIRKCAECGDYDGTLYIHSRCHPRSPVWLALTGDVLTVECAQCAKVVTLFLVATVNEEKN